MNQPILLCGLGLVGRRVLEHLRGLESPIVVIDTAANPNDPDLQHPNITVINGDCRQAELLERAGVRHARAVLILTSEDLVNISTALLVRRLNDEVRIVVRMFNQNLLARLGKSVRNTFAMSVSALAGPRLAMRALDRDVSADYTNPQTGPEQVADYRIRENSVLRGRVIADLLMQYPLKAIAHQPKGEEPRLLLDVDFRSVLKPGDRLMLAGPPGLLDRLRDPDESEEARVRWAGTIRRTYRIVRRSIGEMDMAVKICTLLLMLVVFGSTCFNHFILERSISDSLYRSISVIATGADMRAGDYKDMPYEGTAKIFTSALRLIGVALIAAFTAILTNYLLRARLGGILEAGRIPDSGHVVVCGLGNVGFRVVEELLERGERVVVIEKTPDTTFIPTIRRQGVAVIVGDAVVLQTLQQAKVDTARAVIIVTAEELVNLEVALMVGELNSTAKVVVRLSDSILAETLREAAHVPHAVSIPALAAPAFFAAAFDDHVQAVFRIANHELMIVDLTIHTNDPALQGRTLRSIAIDYNLVPLGVNSPIPSATLNGEIDATNYRVKGGDIITVATTVRTLSRLVQREPALAEWSVRVIAFPIPTRSTMNLWLRQTRGCSPEEADWLMASPPFVFAPVQTRGQAEDWLRLLQRERVQAEIVREEIPSELEAGMGLS